MNEITKTAGYNRAAFYRYFTDISELLDKVEDEICAELGKALNQNVADSTKSPVDSLAAAYTTYACSNPRQEYCRQLMGKGVV